MLPVLTLEWPVYSFVVAVVVPLQLRFVNFILSQNWSEAIIFTVSVIYLEV